MGDRIYGLTEITSPDLPCFFARSAEEDHVVRLSGKIPAAVGTDQGSKADHRNISRGALIKPVVSGERRIKLNHPLRNCVDDLQPPLPFFLHFDHPEVKIDNRKDPADHLPADELL